MNVKFIFLFSLLFFSFSGCDSDKGILSENESYLLVPITEECITHVKSYVNSFNTKYEKDNKKLFVQLVTASKAYNFFGYSGFAKVSGQNLDFSSNVYANTIDRMCSPISVLKFDNDDLGYRIAREKMLGFDENQTKYLAIMNKEYIELHVWK